MPINELFNYFLYTDYPKHSFLKNHAYSLFPIIFLTSTCTLHPLSQFYQSTNTSFRIQFPLQNPLPVTIHPPTKTNTTALRTSRVEIRATAKLRRSHRKKHLQLCYSHLPYSETEPARIAKRERERKKATARENNKHPYE